MTTLLVSATGGHLAELHQLVQRMGIPERERLWVTFPSEQSRTLLAGEAVAWAEMTPPRDVRAVLANVPLARRLFARGDIDRVVSNGSGIALSFLPLARAYGIPAHYIECAARTRGPSLTGRVLERTAPNVNLYTQFPDWANGHWRFAGSVLDEFVVRPREEGASTRRVLVTVGTLFPFRRLVDRLLEILPPEVEVVWQLGTTPVDDLPIETHPSLTPTRLQAEAVAADVIVAHAGIGSALLALNAGSVPILVPRELRRGEHIDNHQREIADELAARGLAIAASVAQLTLSDLERAASHSVTTPQMPPSFHLRAAPAGRRPRTKSRHERTTRF